MSPPQEVARKAPSAVLPAEISLLFAEIGRDFHHRGWVLGTSGNFSAVLGDEPFEMAITASGADKGNLTVDQILRIDADGRVRGDGGKPSDETRLHLCLVKERKARSVLHTHSLWSTLLSDAFAGDGGLAIENFEMLKGLAGVHTHLHREWIPILENSQDMASLAESLKNTLGQHPQAHGFLLRRHGLYTWGQTVREARRHVEILEFLLEVKGRGTLEPGGSLGR
jgi:methylthioribulose-1-phosphate dehydratase